MSPRSSAVFRDTLIVAGLAVAGVVAMLVWSGGEAPAGTEQVEPLEQQSGFTLPPDVTLPAGVTVPGTQGGSAAASPIGTSNAQGEADVIAKDALIAALPVPNGGTEVTPAGAGVRTWTFAGTDWEAVRDDYLGVLRGQGYVVALTGPVDDGGTVGELYTLTDPSGTVSLQLGVATFNGQTGIEVSSQ